MSRTLHVATLAACTAAAAFAATAAPAAAQHYENNPYVVASPAFGQLPDGRKYGATSAVYPAPDGRSIWVAERCGQNNCIDRQDLTTVFQFDLNGKLLRQWGAHTFAWPHGIHVDRDGNVWIADATGFGANPPDLGHVVMKFSPEGKLLMTLGKKGTPGSGHDTFTQPSDVLVAPDGSIFVVDGHGAGGNNRVVKFSADGTYLKEWGKTGYGPGEFRDPHALAMDSQGRLFVGDRANSRIQIFDQEGTWLATWTQFGRPSGHLHRQERRAVRDRLRVQRGAQRRLAAGDLHREREDRVGHGVHPRHRARPRPLGHQRRGGRGRGCRRRHLRCGGRPHDAAEVREEAVSGATRSALALLLVSAATGAPLHAQSANFSFFVTSKGPGNGADLGGLKGADAQCAFMAYNVGAGDLTWHAYLSATAQDGQPGVNARDRIGAGPWYNVDGVMIARDVEDLHGPDNNLNKETALTEKGERVNGRGDDPNMHDILTGSQLDGTAFPADAGDTTCGNWTRSGEGSAWVGHHDRQGGGDHPTSWNSAHLTRGCSQDNLQSTGGNGLFYCFATDPR